VLSERSNESIFHEGIFQIWTPEVKVWLRITCLAPGFEPHVVHVSHYEPFNLDA
jgi:hypothetical protein